MAILNRGKTARHESGTAQSARGPGPGTLISRRQCRVDRSPSLSAERAYLPDVRIERTGQVEALTPQVVRFLTEALGGVGLDNIQSPETRRIDYSCLRGLLAVELKSLEDAGKERLGNLTDELRQREDWPLFLGSAPMESFIRNMTDPEGIQRRVLDRIGRNFLNHLRKANKQLGAHGHNFPRKNIVRLLLFVNEDHEVFDPHTVSYILWHAVRRKDGDRPLYGNVDGILYLTQRHATVQNNKVTFPIVTIEGIGCYHDQWKGDVLDFVAMRWAAWNGYGEAVSRVEPDEVSQFATIDHIPEKAPRSERWRTEYKRTPYLRVLSIEKLRDRFDEMATLNALSMLKKSPVNFTEEQKINLIRQFGDFMQELGDRGIPITAFPHTDEREAAAVRRLDLPEHIIAFLAKVRRR